MSYMKNNKSDFENTSNYTMECSALTKNYGKKTALDNVNLKLPKGSIVGLLGPNGSGKTTLLKLAAGLLTPTSGTVKICGMMPGPETKAITSYQADTVFESDWMTVKDLISMMSDFFKDFNKDKANDMIESLKINQKDKLKTLSKGTKEKVQLITTMSREASLYLLDEPIGGVDPAARDYILSTIIGNYKEDATVVISTHLISEVESVLNHIIFLKEGQIVRQGDIDDIRSQTGKSIDALFREEFKCSM